MVWDLFGIADIQGKELPSAARMKVVQMQRKENNQLWNAYPDMSTGGAGRMDSENRCKVELYQSGRDVHCKWAMLLNRSAGSLHLSNALHRRRKARNLQIMNHLRNIQHHGVASSSDFERASPLTDCS